MLNVATVLEGSVRKSGNRARISVQLVKVAGGYQMWGETYGRTLDDIFAVQDDIAQSVVKELRMALLGDKSTFNPVAIEQEIAKAAHARSASPEAQRLCLQAKFFAEKRTQADIERAIGLFRRAIEIDARYAAAFSGLGRAQELLAAYGTGNARELYMAGKVSAEAALKLDPTDAMAYLSVATYALDVDHDPVTSKELLSKALALAPNDPEVNRHVAHRLANLHQFDEALKALEFAQSLDPLSLMIKINIVVVLYGMRRFTDAEQLLQAVLRTDPTWWMPYAHLSRLTMALGRYAEAVEYYATALELRGKSESARLHRQAFATGGWDGYIRDALARPLEFSLRRAEQAFCLLVSGENERAMDMLNEIIDTCDEQAWVINIDPRFDPLRSDPRYPALLKRAGFAMP